MTRSKRKYGRRKDMTDEQIKVAIRNFLKTMMAGDTERGLTFLTPDAVWVNQAVTLKGSAEIKKYLDWIKKTVKEYKVTENGIGIITQGNIGIIEHSIGGITNGRPWEVMSMCVYEFKDDKIVKIRTFMDRLSMAQQAANGMFARWAVNMVANATQKGLKL
jgi:ketosteroid isomerase-like protein